MAPEAQVPVAAAAQHLGELGKNSQAMQLLPHHLIFKCLHSARHALCAPPQMSTLCCDVKTVTARMSLQAGLHLQMSWQGQDEEGHPMLVVHLGRLCNECQSHELAQQAADALISQVGGP